jgi:hypothetical protein
MAVVTRLYNSYELAQNAVQRLSAAGIVDSDISVVANNADNRFSDRNGKIDRDLDGTDDRTEGAGTGVGIGATLGGAAGLLTGLGNDGDSRHRTGGRSGLVGIDSSRSGSRRNGRRHHRRPEPVGCFRGRSACVCRRRPARWNACDGSGLRLRPGTSRIADGRFCPRCEPFEFRLSLIGLAKIRRA